VAADGGNRVLINPTALISVCEIGKIVKFLLPLINNKWPPGDDPSGHCFVFLNVSINKKPFFFSEVVTYRKTPPDFQMGFYSRFNNFLKNASFYKILPGY
jgi:hypothetical protein